MRWKMIAAGLLMALGSSDAFAQMNPYVNRQSANPYVNRQSANPYVQQAMNRPILPPGWIDVNCTPTRIIILNQRPPMYPTYPPVYPPYPFYPMPLAMPMQMAPPAQLAPPAQPPIVVAGVNFQREAAPQRAPIYTTPVAPRVEPAVKAEANPEEEAARKLKLAQYLERDGKADKARQRYQEIVQNYPDTAAAAEARQLLNQGGG